MVASWPACVGTVLYAMLLLYCWLLLLCVLLLCWVLCGAGALEKKWCPYNLLVLLQEGRIKAGQFMKNVIPAVKIGHLPEK